MRILTFNNFDKEFDLEEVIETLKNKGKFENLDSKDYYVDLFHDVILVKSEKVLDTLKSYSELKVRCDYSVYSYILDVFLYEDIYLCNTKALGELVIKFSEERLQELIEADTLTLETKLCECMNSNIRFDFIEIAKEYIDKKIGLRYKEILQDLEHSFYETGFLD